MFSNHCELDLDSGSGCRSFKWVILFKILETGMDINWCVYLNSFFALYTSEIWGGNHSFYREADKTSFLTCSLQFSENFIWSKHDCLKLNFTPW